MTDPRLIGLSPESRMAAIIANARKRVAILERSTPNAGTGASGTGPLDGEVEGPIGSNNIVTTSTPQMARLGLGKAAHASAPLSVDAGTAMTLVLDDTQDGEDQTLGGVCVPGTRYQIEHGTAAAPITTHGATLKVSRIEEMVSGAQNGLRSFNFGAITGISIGQNDSASQACGLVGVAHNSNTNALISNGDNVPDAAGLFSRGLIEGTGAVGVGIGAFVEGIRQVSTANANALEAQVRNQGGADGSYNTSGLSNITGLWVPLNDRKGGVAICIPNPFGYQYNVGIGIPAQVVGGFTGGIQDSSFRDDGTATNSILVAGTHTYCFLANSATAGKMVVGTSGSTGTLVLFRNSTATDAALVCQGASGQSVDVFSCLDNAGAQIFGISSVGNVRIVDAKNVVLGSTTGTKFGTATTQKLGFWNVTPVVQPSAYTQTYSTATKTHANLTSATLTDSTGGAADTTVANVGGSFNQSTLNNNFADLAAQCNALRVDLENVKQVVNSLIDDHQSTGLCA